MAKSKLRTASGITLVALVVTIVVLIILATISVSVIFGKNGLVNRAAKAKEKHQIEAAQEKLVIKLAELQADAIEQGKRLTLEDLIIINTTEKDMIVETTTEDEEGNEIPEKVVIYKEEGEKDYTKVKVDGYVFKVDENFGVEYIGGSFGNDPKTNPEKDKDYEGAEDDDELEEDEIILDEERPIDPDADKIHSTVPKGWIGIYTEEDLINVKKDLSKKYIIMNDIELTKPWTPLGDRKTEFTGYLNGNGYRVSNMKINGTEGYLGMFARTSGTAVITNLTLRNSEITGSGNYIGNLVGYNKGNIRGVSITGNMNLSNTSRYIGGLVGYHRYYSKTTTGIERVYTGGTLNAPQGTYVGGIVGLMQGYSSTYNHLTYIKNSYSTMATTGDIHVGGLVGSMRYSHLYNTYTIGKTVGKRLVGGVVASVNRHTYANNTYWGKGITGQTQSALGIKKTVQELIKQPTYNSYDFTKIWGIDEDETTAYLLGMEVPSALKELLKGFLTQLGDGTEDNPYQIWTVEQLQNVKNHLEAYYIVMADLDLGEVNSWTPLGTETAPFTGNLNGNGHTIENMTIKNCGSNAGLFGYIEGAKIYDLTLENYNITGGAANNVGGLVGCLKAGKASISKVYAKGTITLSSTSSCVGGLLGYISSPCSIEQCYSGGEILAKNASDVGGFIGRSYRGGASQTPHIDNCYSTTNVEGNKLVGGLIGYMEGGEITYSYAIGKVKGTSDTGGIVGSKYGGGATSSYWCAETTGQLKGSIGVNLSFTNMSKQATYSGWDFASIWAIEEDSSTAYLQGMKVPEEVYTKVSNYIPYEGDGSSKNPYLITNAEQLDRVRYDLAGYYKIVNDINLSEYSKWEPIGTSTLRFTGSLDGDGHTISNMKINAENTTNLGENIGLFGYAAGGTIKNLTLENYSITGGSGKYVGGLIGTSDGVNISKVYTKGTIKLLSTKETFNHIGGLTGRSILSTQIAPNISQCYTEGDIITPNATAVGGITGTLSGYSTTYKHNLSNSYTSVNINAKSYVGGLIGTASSYTNITNSYAVGQVNGSDSAIGGLVGSTANPSTCTSSYWCAETTGQLTSALGINTTITNLSRQASYSGWDFSTIWAIEEETSLAYLQGMKVPDMVYDKMNGYAVMQGKGTAKEPYIITTAAQLDRVRYNLDKYYQLGSNINLSNITKWEPIGTSTNPFTGSLDGNGYTISNMNINESTSTDLGSNTGLFGYISGATITNVVLDNYNISGGSGKNIGGFVGYAEGASISKIYTNGTITLSSTSNIVSYIGGIAGQVNSLTTKGVTMNQCYAEGKVIANTGTHIGGIVGGAAGKSAYLVAISNSYSNMNITGKSTIGGLLGYAGAYTNINNSYALGKIQASGTSAGGFVGGKYNSTATSSYWCVETTGQEASELGTEATISKLVKQQGYGNWNFNTIWAIDEGTSTAYLQGMKKPDAVTQVVKNYPVMEGIGTSTSPYVITNAQQLDKVRYGLSAYYQLGNDIDLSSITRWEPIGTINLPFTGNFNGNGHIITGLKLEVTASQEKNIGLFGYIQGATITNIGLNDYKISGTGYANNIGALVGYSERGKISKSHTNGVITLTNRTYSNNIGGLVGYATSSKDGATTISECYTEGTIHVEQGRRVGGLLGEGVGLSSYVTTITNCYSNMNITAYSSIGGLIGELGIYTKIQNTYASGKIIGSSKATTGGLLGAKASSTTCTSSYWDTVTTGQAESVLGIGHDTAAMQTAATYSGWSSTIWNIVDGSYPTLK